MTSFGTLFGHQQVLSILTLIIFLDGAKLKVLKELTSFEYNGILDKETINTHSDDNESKDSDNDENSESENENFDK
jgi:hypothetical protein